MPNEPLIADHRAVPTPANVPSTALPSVDITSLDSLESTVDCEKTPHYHAIDDSVESEREPHVDSSVDFRHSGWNDKRRRVRDALQCTSTPPAALRRFDACGSNAWVLRSRSSPERVRIVCDRCHSRWCDPCAAERRRTVCRNLRTFAASRRLRLATFTLKSTAAPLRQQVNRLYRSFRRFRQRREISRIFRGGVFFLELTRNTQTNLFHPHLHVIFEGAYLPQSLARKHWMSVTSDSFIVDVRDIKTSSQAASYVAKYASKSIDRSIWNNAAALVETIEALRGTRTFSCFGTWKAAGLSRVEHDATDWESIGSLDLLRVRAEHGDAESLAILERLQGVYLYAPPRSARDHQRSPPLPGLHA